MRVVVVANGLDVPPPSVLAALLGAADLVVAADGGATHALALGVTPALVVGDMDSLTAEALGRLAAEGAVLERHPVRKDRTDLDLALERALAGGATDLVVAGALGGRPDHGLVGLFLATGLAAPSVRLVGDGWQMTTVRPGRPVTLEAPTHSTASWMGSDARHPAATPGDTLSLVPLCAVARGVSTTGLEYPLTSEDLPFGTTRGVSNVVRRVPSTITLTDGVALCFLVEGDSVRDMPPSPNPHPAP